jgi:hypothetical protein
MRSLDAHALEEFIDRFQHLVLLQARRLRVPSEDRKAWTADLLYDVASSICRQPHRIGLVALVPYLITACRRKVLVSRRDRMVRERTDAGLMGDLGGEGESALLTTCSEDAVRRTYGPDVEPIALHPVLERLVSMFEHGVSNDERMLLSWVAQRTSYSLIATWLGITRSAAVKRVTRLRARLVDAAMRFGKSLGREDRAEFLRFVRRSRAFTEADLEALAASERAFTVGRTHPAPSSGADVDEEKAP